MHVFFMLICCFTALSLTAQEDNRSWHTWTQTYMENAVQFDHFSGSVLVTRKGKILFRKSYGLANREKAESNNEQTRFKIGSLSKQFTAVAILQLAEQGKLSLDASVRSILPECPPSWQPVTIRHLLQHRSGIQSFTALDTANGAFLRMPHTHEQIMALVTSLPLRSPAGQEFAYNNTGYFLLGMVVEKISGKRLNIYVQQFILDPLRLRSTGFLQINQNDIARSYYVDSSGYIKPSYVTHPDNLFAIGGMYSSVEDLQAWERGLQQARILSQTSVEEMFKPGMANFGYSWITDTLGTIVRRYHDGGVDGYSASLHTLPEQQITIIAISNMGDDGAIRVCYDLAGHLGGNPCTLRAIQEELLLLSAEESLALIRGYQKGFPGFDASKVKLEELAKWAKLAQKNAQALEIEKLIKMLYPQ